MKKITSQIAREFLNSGLINKKAFSDKIKIDNRTLSSFLSERPISGKSESMILAGVYEIISPYADADPDLGAEVSPVELIVKNLDSLGGNSIYAGWFLKYVLVNDSESTDIFRLFGDFASQLYANRG